MRSAVSVSSAGAAAPREVLVSPWQARFVPDLALTAAVFTLFYCLFLFEGGRKLFRDSDSGWHIRAGESILATGSLPRTDLYSFTKAGEPWFAWEWGADLVMGAAHRAAGLPGVALLYATLIAACTWLWFRLTWIAGGNFLLACALAALMLSTTNIHWLARPHVMSWIFLLGAVMIAEKASASLVTIGVGAALWANLHASFFLAPLIALIYAAASALRPAIWNLDGDAEWRRARWFLRAACVAAIGTLLNPYGWNLHRHVWRYLTDSELLARIGEFQSFNFHAQGALQILITVGVGALGGALALGQRKLAQFLLAVGVIAMALRSARALPLVALLVLPLANSAIAEALSLCSGLRPALRRALDRSLAYSDRLRLLDARLGGLALAPIVLALFSLGVLRAGFPPDQFPVEAAAAVERLPGDARLLAPDKFGGYLIYRFAGSRKVFFDGRSDLYGSEFLKQYARLVQLRPGWRDMLDRYRFTHALLPNDYSLVPALVQLGWKELYRDDVATLLEKPI